MDEPDLKVDTIDHKTEPTGASAVVDEQTTFEQFYVSEYRSLTTLARVLSGSSLHAEDIAQEAMLAAYRKWDHVRGLDIPVAWVRRVCANLATSRIRRQAAEARAMLRLRRQFPPDEPEKPLADPVFWEEVRKLPRRQAQCVALFYLYQCSVHETAVTLECSDGTVKSHLSRARATLAERLSDSVAIVEES
jgi:RNA polymerase sigma factor (sigma-70 family)